MCQSLTGIDIIISFIDKRKLKFLQKLCCLEDNFLTKKLFLVRLFSYFIDTERIHYGFIPDIINILYRYNLHQYLSEFILEGTFPTKTSWKIIVNNAVDDVQRSEWLVRITNDSDFTRFKKIHTSVILANYLKHSYTNREIRNSYFITKLITDIPNSTSNLCVICYRQFRDVYVHACCNCSSTRIH